MRNHIYILLLVLLIASSAMAQSPYISCVYEYRPAPGQFINIMPAYEEGDTEASMTAKANDCLANHNQELVCLGGWGGSITFGFDHPVVNVPGEYDLKILGNAFYADANPKDTAVLGGSAEPGIVMVSYDSNGNGEPDDAWYELAGSEYNAPETRHNYSMTYYRTPADHTPTKDPTRPYLIDTSFVRYTSSDGEEGYIYQNSFHKQAYYPQWLPDTVTYTGSRLRENAIDESGTGRYFVLYCFDWGYVDNHPNEVVGAPERHASEFMIDWAVDEQGNSVQLPAIHFVRVYTALHQYAGWLGETSTEILDAWDMHPDAPMPMAVMNGKNEETRAIKYLVNGQLHIFRNGRIYNQLGRIVR